VIVPGKRIVVIGTSGSGKTTVARAIADVRQIPHIELDALHWEPNWVEADDADFRARLRAELSADAWVVDGNYLEKVGNVVWSAADTIVWLDLPLPVVLWRITGRTARRIVRREELWNGNRERLRALATRDSMLLWVLRTHLPNRLRFRARIDEPQHAHLHLIRLRTTLEIERFLEALTAPGVSGDDG
jgi:adenylate kinase family enzyme